MSSTSRQRPKLMPVLDKNICFLPQHRPVRAEEARLFAPSRSILTGFLSWGCFEMGLPPLLSTNGFSADRVSFYSLSRTRVKLKLMMEQGAD